MPRILCSSNKKDTLNTALNDSRISLKALGLLTKLTSLENVKITRTWLEDELVDGKTSIATAFKELINLGYLKTERNILKCNGKVEYLYKIQCPNLYFASNQKYLIGKILYKRFKENDYQKFNNEDYLMLLNVEKNEKCEIYLDDEKEIKNVLLVYNNKETNEIKTFSYDSFKEHILTKNINLF